MHVLNIGKPAEVQVRPMAEVLHPAYAPALKSYDRRQLAQHSGIGEDLPAFETWPWRRINGELIVAGVCPFCGLPHSHGLSNNPVRTPHCSVGIPPFVRGRDKPLLYRLVVNDHQVPADLLFELQAERQDLLNTQERIRRRASYGEKMLRLHGAQSRVRKRSEKVNRALFADACRAIIDAGICDERAAIQIEDGGEAEAQAYRDVLAGFIHRQGPGKRRLRLERALRETHKMVGRGVML